jgi:hypothetical protein
VAKDSRPISRCCASPQQCWGTEEAQGTDPLLNRDDVLARWAYSELLTRLEYDRLDYVANLREKLRQNTPFETLSDQDRGLLLNAWQAARGNGTVFAEALNEVTQFELIKWTKHQLGAVHVIPHFVMDVCQIPQTRITFREWINADPIRPLHQTHARYALYGAVPP